MTQTTVAVTCGDPAGVGLDLIAPAWRALRDEMVFALIGDPSHLPPDVPVGIITDISQAARVMPHAVPVLLLDIPGPRCPGNPQAAQAPSILRSIEIGATLAQSGKASALCTLPIHKQALAKGADFRHPGHTEFLAYLAGVDDVVMMLASPILRVIPITIHIPLSEVPKALTSALLKRRIRITHTALIQQFGITAPRLAVAGLNPHAGEGGRMGREEIDVISPVLDDLRTEGINLSGPLSADTLFHSAARAGYDAAICMYHDQALVPIKTLDFERGVNITLGLPYLRTSPDHGTAFDIAGTDRGNPTSLIAALRLAGGLE